MENTIEKTPDYMAIIDGGGDIAYFDSHIGKIIINAENVNLYRNGAIELINFLKDKFEI